MKNIFTNFISNPIPSLADIAGKDDYTSVNAIVNNTVFICTICKKM